MIFNLQNTFEHDKFKEYVRKLYEQKAIVEVKKKLPNRTCRQNNYFYLLLGWFASETGYSIDEVKLEFFKRKCNKDLFVRTKTNKFGKEISFLRSSSELTTGEMTTAIERFRNWSAAEGVYLPAPNESDFLIHIQQEMERQKEYL